SKHSMATAKRLARILVPREVRNWLRSPTNSMGWAWAQAKYLVGAKHVVQMRPGWSLICHPAAFRFAYFSQNDDPDQVAEFDCFIKEITPGAVLFDIGAHFGLFSLAALHYGGANSIALAVDPSPIAAQLIKKQARLNGVSNRFHIVQAAVSDRMGWQSMVSVGILSSGYFVPPSTEHTASELTQTRTTTLDRLVEEFNLLPTHVKIDVEGYELGVISGGVKLLSRDNAPLLFIELHNEIVRQNGGSPTEMLRLLRTLSYEIFATNGDRIDDQEILNRPLIRIVAKRNSRL
ncbi:MAG TPA: FkbM family methyltransferase, partial [Nitrososphaera sp.]|nr:FkbM family methyltransferase [Nitrososphaera sp.]